MFRSQGSGPRCQEWRLGMGSMTRGADPDLPQRKGHFPRASASGSWYLQTPPSAHPFCQSGPDQGSGSGIGSQDCPEPWGLIPVFWDGLVAQLVRARA